MFHNRPCGCKGARSCLECEEKYGAWDAAKQISDGEKVCYNRVTRELTPFVYRSS